MAVQAPLQQRTRPALRLLVLLAQLAALARLLGRGLARRRGGEAQGGGVGRRGILQGAAGARGALIDTPLARRVQVQVVILRLRRRQDVKLHVSVTAGPVLRAVLGKLRAELAA